MDIQSGSQWYWSRRKNVSLQCGTHNLFYMPQPHASWTLDEAAGKWNPPIAYPAVVEYSQLIDNPSDEDHGKTVTMEHVPTWDETNQRWVSGKNIPTAQIGTAINVWKPQ